MGCTPLGFCHPRSVRHTCKERSDGPERQNACVLQWRQEGGSRLLIFCIFFFPNVQRRHGISAWATIVDLVFFFKFPSFSLSPQPLLLSLLLLVSFLDSPLFLRWSFFWDDWAGGRFSPLVARGASADKGTALARLDPCGIKRQTAAAVERSAIAHGHGNAPWSNALVNTRIDVVPWSRAIGAIGTVIVASRRNVITAVVVVAICTCPRCKGDRHRSRRSTRVKHARPITIDGVQMRLGCLPTCTCAHDGIDAIERYVTAVAYNDDTRQCTHVVERVAHLCDTGLPRVEHHIVVALHGNKSWSARL